MQTLNSMHIETLSTGKPDPEAGAPDASETGDADAQQRCR
jgi:hypothetical protein